jgi:hypothetical protein
MLSFRYVENLMLANKAVVYLTFNLIVPISAGFKTYTYGFGSLQRCSVSY